MKKIVIIGATSGIAGHCARLWVRDEPAELTLVGRDAARLERVAKDLRARSASSKIDTMTGDFASSAGVMSSVDALIAKGVPDIVLIAHGSLPEQRDCQTRLETCREAMEINGLSPALFAEAFAAPMEKAGKGTIALIGSVAGDRGRKSNYVYGSAKALVARYAQGMQHRFAGTGIRIVLVKPGPTDTPMTAHLKGKGLKLAPAEDVARCIVEGIARGKREIYAPARWRWIMLVISHMPSFVFHRLNL